MAMDIHLLLHTPWKRFGNEIEAFVEHRLIGLEGTNGQLRDALLTQAGQSFHKLLKSYYDSIHPIGRLEGEALRNHAEQVRRSYEELYHFLDVHYFAAKDDGLSNLLSTLTGSLATATAEHIEASYPRSIRGGIR